MNDDHGIRDGARTGASCGQGEEVRCFCRNLVARRVGASIELKCRRCRRILLLELVEDGGVRIRPQPG